MLLKVTNCKIKILEKVEASYGMIPITDEINVAMRKQICQKMAAKELMSSCKSDQQLLATEDIYKV